MCVKALVGFIVWWYSTNFTTPAFFSKPAFYLINAQLYNFVKQNEGRK